MIIDNFTEEGKGCISADYRPAAPYHYYAEMPLSACKYLCQYQHNAICSMVMYLIVNRSCYIQPLREPVGNRHGCENAVWYSRHRIAGNCVCLSVNIFSLYKWGKCIIYLLNFTPGDKNHKVTISAISSTQVSDSHLSPPGALQSRRASLQWT